MDWNAKILLAFAIFILLGVCGISTLGIACAQRGFTDVGYVDGSIYCYNRQSFFLPDDSIELYQLREER